MKNKMGCPIRMGCKGDEKKKLYTQEGWYGMGMKKIGMPKKDGMPRG